MSSVSSLVLGGGGEFRALHRRLQKAARHVGVALYQVLAGYVRQAERGNSEIGGVEHDRLEAQVSYDVRLVGLEGGEDVHPALREDARVESNPNFLDARAVDARRFQYGEIVGRDAHFVAERPALPVFGRADAGIGERQKRLLSALPEQRYGDYGQPRVGAALEDGVGVRRRELHLVRH